VVKIMRKHPHPGELLKEDVLEPLGLSISEAAERLGMARGSLSRVVNGHTGISSDLAVRLERAGVSTARFWMTLQANYELEHATKRKQPRIEPWQTSNPTTKNPRVAH
jgi:antitoxin HigA-1